MAVRRALSIAGLSLVVAMGLFVVSPPQPSQAATALGPDFVDDYTLLDLGQPAGVPLPLGGVTIKVDDPNVLLVGGSANTANGAIYAVPIERDPVTDEVIGFAGPGTLYADAPYIDGGLAYMPGTQTLFFTAYPTHQIGQILPGQTAPARIDDLAGTGIPESVGSFVFTPVSFGGSGALRVLSFSQGGFYTLPFTPNGDGTVTLGATATPGPAVPSGAEGVVYVPDGSAAFPAPSMLIANYSNQSVSAYEVDGVGAPVLDTERPFLSGLTGVVGSYIDVLSGDFLFTSFHGGNSVTVVRGFASTEIAPMIHTAWVPTATVGSPYITAIAVTGEPMPSVVVSAGELPPGLAFDPLSRVISGVPEAPGEFSFSVTATNSAGTDTRAFNISVAPLTVVPDITTTALPDGKVGTAYEAAVAATGVPAPTFEVVSGALAPGLTLDAVTGKITGTPSEAGDFTWEVAAINSAGRDTQEFRVVIAASPVITPSPTPASSQTPSLAASGIDPTPLILAGAVGAVVIVAGAVTFLVGRRRQG
ncbi:hypothetical protein JOD62_000237 [Microbacterium keratanolyticum]|uniref:Uncharacterized protein n=1 Tax=Microbacterium keratanolyticum TaxID=67574 RepID=A0A9W6HTL8_9MICO|nr:putative Ig domain-containing protein [Microbacterium keratanolyticum]MBM7467689.1 hypothetical protein [Microbacterium keratanolyticum]GLK02682.1 hypothetical protein GCM10017596_23970 [Microbacterium keratanolyticum]